MVEDGSLAGEVRYRDKPKPNQNNNKILSCFHCFVLSVMNSLIIRHINDQMAVPKHSSTEVFNGIKKVKVDCINHHSF